MNNVEIKGILKGNGAHASEIVKSIGAVVKDADIDICHAVPARRNEIENIVIRFVTRKKRNEFLVASCKSRLTTKTIGFPDSEIKPVYVNEHLTQTKKQLMGAVVARKKEKRWKHVWTTNGKIFARQADDSDILYITCKQDISKIN